MLLAAALSWWQASFESFDSYLLDKSSGKRNMLPYPTDKGLKNAHAIQFPPFQKGAFPIGIWS